MEVELYVVTSLFTCLRLSVALGWPKSACGWSTAILLMHGAAAQRQTKSRAVLSFQAEFHRSCEGVEGLAVSERRRVMNASCRPIIINYHNKHDELRFFIIHKSYISYAPDADRSTESSYFYRVSIC